MEKERFLSLDNDKLAHVLTGLIFIFSLFLFREVYIIKGQSKGVSNFIIENIIYVLYPNVLVIALASFAFKNKVIKRIYLVLAGAFLLLTIILHVLTMLLIGFAHSYSNTGL
ncbi:MAG: hypothetical protein ACO1N9_02725 [Flavobacterium sp.]